MTDRTLAADIDRVRRQVLRAGAAGALASAGCLAGEFPTGSGPDTTKGPSSTKTTGPGAGGGDAVATFTYELAEAGLVGRVRDVIVACDKVAWPAQAWTTDGLYAGYFLDDRVDDGLPNTVYHWLWAPADDGSRKDAIVNADNEAEGTVIEHDGDVYWFVNGWQNEVVYRIHGWDDFTRTEATASIDEEPPHPANEGTGLDGAYYTSPDLSGEPAAERVDERVWFMQNSWYGIETGDWRDGLDVIDKRTGFSVRWTGEVEAPLSEAFTFSVSVGDDKKGIGIGGSPSGRVRLWVDGDQVVHGFGNRGLIETEPIALEAGERVPIQLEYEATTESPAVSLNWDSHSLERRRIESKHLYPTAVVVAEPQPRDARGTIDASAFTTAPTDVRGTNPLRLDPGQTVGYEDLDFGDGVSSITAVTQTHPNYPNFDNSAPEIEHRLDGPDGEVIGCVQPPPQKTPPAEVTVDVSVSEVHDLYVRNTGGSFFRIHRFRVE